MRGGRVSQRSRVLSGEKFIKDIPSYDLFYLLHRHFSSIEVRQNYHISTFDVVDVDRVTAYVCKLTSVVRQQNSFTVDAMAGSEAGLSR